MTEEHHPLWSALCAAPAEVVCREADVSAGPDGAFEVPLLDALYRVRPQEHAVTGPGTAGPVHGDEELLLVAYLAGAKQLPFTGRWVSPHGLPGGNLFFRGPHEPPLLPLIRRFGTDPQGLLAAGLDLGGSRLAFGDVSVELRALPRVLVAPVLWAADDEFPARASMLFDSSVGACLPLDVLLALMGVVVRRLIAVADSAPRQARA